MVNYLPVGHDSHLLVGHLPVSHLGDQHEGKMADMKAFSSLWFFHEGIFITLVGHFAFMLVTYWGCQSPTRAVRHIGHQQESDRQPQVGDRQVGDQHKVKIEY